MRVKLSSVRHNTTDGTPYDMDALVLTADGRKFARRRKLANLILRPAEALARRILPDAATLVDIDEVQILERLRKGARIDDLLQLACIHPSERTGRLGLYGSRSGGFAKGRNGLGSGRVVVTEIGIPAPHALHGNLAIRGMSNGGAFILPAGTAQRVFTFLDCENPTVEFYDRRDLQAPITIVWRGV
jgi:hypothetical protein